MVPGTNRPVRFGGKDSVTVAPGESVWSDRGRAAVRGAGQPELAGRKLAVSFHVAGESGPMTWHAKALQTSYVTAPGAGRKGRTKDEAAFPFSTASWYFLDAIEMTAPRTTLRDRGIRRFDHRRHGVDDERRRPLARRAVAPAARRPRQSHLGRERGHRRQSDRGPARIRPQKPFPGGPAARQRIERDVLEIVGRRGRDLARGHQRFQQERQRRGRDGRRRHEGERRPYCARRARHARDRRDRASPRSGSSSAAHGFPEQDAKRKALNEFIRTSGLFDAVIDFDKVTLDPATGGLKPEFVPDSTTGGPGDKLHPNRAGYLAMGMAIDLDLLKPKQQARR